MRRKQTIIDTKHIEVFPVINAETTSAEKRILRTKGRKKVQKMADEAKAHGKAVWKVLRGDQKSKEQIMVKELYCGRGGGAVTAVAKKAGVAVGRPRDLVLGDSFLNSKEQHEIIQELEDEDPHTVVIAFPCDPWTSLSNFKDGFLKEWEQAEGFNHLKFLKRVCKSQLARGRHFLIENPLASQACIRCSGYGRSCITLSRCTNVDLDSKITTTPSFSSRHDWCQALQHWQLKCQ